MDITEFEKTTKPKAKKSKLEPFKASIFELKEKGYANWQIRDWLVSNGIKITQEGVRTFIKSRIGTESVVTVTAPQTTTDSRNKDIDLINKTSVPGFGKPKPIAPKN